MSSKNYEADGYKHDLDSESSRTNCAFRIIGAVGARRKKYPNNTCLPWYRNQINSYLSNSGWHRIISCDLFLSLDRESCGRPSLRFGCSNHRRPTLRSPYHPPKPRCHLLIKYTNDQSFLSLSASPIHGALISWLHLWSQFDGSNRVLTGPIIPKLPDYQVSEKYSTTLNR